MKESKPFYKKKHWKVKRSVILRRDEYMCQECKRYGKTTEAQTVHHIYPISSRSDLAMVNMNLISLCNKCHERMHDRQTDELTALGMRWVERIKNKIPPIS